MNLTTFMFQDKNQLKVLKERDTPWFHAGQVCEILEFGSGNASRTLGSLEKDGRIIGLDYTLLSDGVGRPALYVNTAGLFELIFESKSVVAREFRYFVTHTVLPEIVKTGSYTAKAEDRQYFQPFGITLQLKISECESAIAGTDAASPKIKALIANKRLLEAEYLRQPKQRPTGHIEGVEPEKQRQTVPTVEQRQNEQRQNEQRQNEQRQNEQRQNEQRQNEPEKQHQTVPTVDPITGKRKRKKKPSAISLPLENEYN